MFNSIYPDNLHTDHPRVLSPYNSFSISFRNLSSLICFERAFYFSSCSCCLLTVFFIGAFFSVLSNCLQIVLFSNFFKSSYTKFCSAQRSTFTFLGSHNHRRHRRRRGLGILSSITKLLPQNL
jgi:hypothetical protein